MPHGELIKVMAKRKTEPPSENVEFRRMKPPRYPAGLAIDRQAVRKNRVESGVDEYTTACFNPS